MAITEKAREKLDDASREIKDAVGGLKRQVAELNEKVKNRLSGAGEGMKETAEELTREVKVLSEKVKELIPLRRKSRQLPVQVSKTTRSRSETWEHPFLELQRATNQLFDDFSRGFGWPGDSWRAIPSLTPDIFGAQWPRVDMSETDEEILITAELPGVDKDNLEISVSENKVTIRGEKKEKEEKKGRGYYQLECSYGSFHRSFPLPCEIESENAEASFKDGMLTVNLPKTSAARDRIRRIPVRTG